LGGISKRSSSGTPSNLDELDTVKSSSRSGRPNTQALPSTVNVPWILNFTSGLSPNDKVSDGSQPPMTLYLSPGQNGWLPFAAPLLLN
jgi:hypothetical protein